MKSYKYYIFPLLILLFYACQHFTPSASGQVTKTTWSETKTISVNNKNFNVKTVCINLNSQWIKIRPGLGNGYLGGTEELSSLAGRYRAVAAINGTFFNSYSDMQPQGNLQIDGRFIHLSNTGTTVGFSKDRDVQFSPLRVAITGTTDNNNDFKHNWYAWGINHIYTDPSVIEIFTPAKGTKTGVKAGTSVVVNNGIVDSVITGEAAIPVNGYVVNFGTHPNASKYIDRFLPGTAVDYNFSFSDVNGKAIDWSNITHSIGAGPRLLAAGKVVNNPQAEGFTDPKIISNSGARSAIGKTTDNILILATVGAATISELAEIMQKLGAVEAMNLDGGASSGLYYKGSYLTKPGRKISNALLIFEQEPDINITINGTTRTFPAKPYITGGTTLVPLRGIFESLGAEVAWSGVTQTISATKDGTIIELQIGNKTATVNSKQVTLNQAPIIKGSYTFVPLRFVSEAFGATVNWDPNTYTVNIYSK